MRKDFLVDPYQVLEARAAGAGGVLVILRMLPRERLAELLEAAAEHGLFVLLEAFDDARSRRSPASCSQARARRAEVLLVGVNCRDLADVCEVVPERFAELAPLLPRGRAGGGRERRGDGRRRAQVRRLGYRLALDRHRADEP